MPIISGGGAGAGGSSVVTRISDTILGVDTASFDLQNIPGTFVHLWLVLSLRSDVAATNDGAIVRFNNDSGLRYFNEQCQVQGGTFTGSDQNLTGSPTPCLVPGNTAPAGSFGLSHSVIGDYANATTMKSLVGLVGMMRATAAGNNYTITSGFVYNQTVAITRVTILPLNGTVWRATSRCTLYGLS